MDERRREPFLAGQTSSTLPLALVGTISFHMQLHSLNKQTINQSTNHTFTRHFNYRPIRRDPSRAPLAVAVSHPRVKKYSFTSRSLLAHTNFALNVDHAASNWIRPFRERLRRARPHTFAGVSFAASPQKDAREREAFQPRRSSADPFVRVV